MEAADRHIATLEEKLFKLKEVSRELKQLKQEKQLLRKSPERRIGQVLLAPYRLPQKLIRALRRTRPQKESVTRSAGAVDYQRWFEKHRAGPGQLAAMRAAAANFLAKPLISVITPVFNTPVAWLEQTIQSVLAQTYENWELILVDDGSTDPALRQYLSSLGNRDSRIRVFELESNRGISAASNYGLEHLRGDWIGFLDHDDLLEPDALFQTAKLLQRFPDADVIYSDEDKLTEAGFERPLFKPDWSPDFFLSGNYLCHFITVRTELVRRVGGFRSEFNGAQDYDLLFRVIEQTDRIHHVPRVLYHWRRSASSSAIDVRQKPGQLEAARRAVEEHLERKGTKARVAIDWPTHTFWVQRELVEPQKISIIIALRDRVELLSRCLESISGATYPNYEIVILGNDDQLKDARPSIRAVKHRLLNYEGPFNLSTLNNVAVEQTQSPWLLFLHDDVEVVDGEWLGTMAEHIQRPEVGAVAPLLLYPNNSIEHAGVVVGTAGIAQDAFRGFPADDAAVLKQAGVTRNYSCVTGACLLTRRDAFKQVGGFDERLPLAFYDVDFCLKLRRAGYLIVYTPFARLYHHDTAGRTASAGSVESDVIRERWAQLLERDPYYNPNLSRERADFSLGN